MVIMTETNKASILSKAFIAAQKSFGPALKSSTNPHFRSKYADLSACVEAVIDALHANGFGLIQITYECDSGVKVETRLLHESGDSINFGVLHVPAVKSDPQGYGSALTYARRYSLMTALGLAPEDDDGNAASKPRASFQYDIRAMEQSKTGAAVRYLKESNCTLGDDGVWTCPQRMDRLSTYAVGAKSEA
jgi:hypothetical protein